MNLFFRARHTAHRGADLLDKLGLSIHIMLAAANKVAKHEHVDHVVFALEGRNNWRKAFYPPYKKQRAEERAAASEEQIEEDEMYFETLNDLVGFLKTYTNSSVITEDTAEADDVIARWIKLHPDDEHIILSSDSDFQQLISETVTIYNGITKETITLNGTFNDNDKPIIDKKTNLPKQIEDPKWILFEKCMRGDKSDNVFSAYPGVRKKGSKNKVGLLEAFEDRTKKGYAWNNLMLQRWMDHKDSEHKVIDDYERNVKLIDLDAQPDDIKNNVDEAIINTVLTDMLTRKANNQISFQFMKFCGKHDLDKLAQYPESVLTWMTKPYKGDIAKYGTD